MNDSAANVDCGPFGSRRLPVRSGVSQTAGRPTTSPAILRLGIDVHVRRHRGTPAGRSFPPRSHQLRDQHGIRLVVADVVVVAGTGVVVVARSDAPAHPERRASSPGMPGSWYPTPSPHRASTACERAGRSRARSRPPRKPRPPPPCGRSPAGPASRPHARDPAACRETWRHLSACHRTSCRSNRRSSDRSTGPPWHERRRTRCVPGRVSRTRLRSSLPRPKMPHRDLPRATDCGSGPGRPAGVAVRM